MKKVTPQNARAESPWRAGPPNSQLSKAGTETGLVTNGCSVTAILDEQGGNKKKAFKNTEELCWMNKYAGKKHLAVTKYNDGTVQRCYGPHRQGEGSVLLHGSKK